MKYVITEKRRAKIEKVALQRQFSLHLVLENIHDPHNVSAIFRTCEGAGIPNVSLVYNIESFPKIGKKSSASAYKWIDKDKYTNVDECYGNLRKQGFKIYASTLEGNPVSLYDLDLTEKCALVMGNEHRGISQEAGEKADKTFMIPMHGIIQSLNVSVSAAIILYEAARQRGAKGLYDKSELNDEQLSEFIDYLAKK